jgi:transposase
MLGNLAKVPENKFINQKESPMSNVTSLAIDLAKNVFQLHGTDKTGKAILKKKLTRGKLLEFMANLSPCDIYMEACSSSNYWGREFIKLGHKVKLIHPKYVTPYVKRNKNDANDAAAIAAAARDPDMRFCMVKTEEQQDMQSLHRIRSLLIRQRTALANQIRGILAEYGTVIPKGINHARSSVPEILGNNPNNMSPKMLEAFAELYKNFRYLDERIATCDKKISILFNNSDTCKRLAKIPGIGELVATILTTILGNGSGFKNGRHFAAFLGLVPKQRSSGDKERLLGISKGGDTYTRTLLIHGARAVLQWVDKKNDKQSVWLKNLKLRAGKNRAAVALANKIARTAWALVYENSEYKPSYKPKLTNMVKQVLAKAV